MVLRLGILATLLISAYFLPHEWFRAPQPQPSDDAQLANPGRHAPADPTGEEQRSVVPEEARVTLAFAKRDWFLGENILAHFCVRNAGRSVVPVNTGGDYRFASRHLRFHVQAVDEKGHVAADPDPDGYCAGGISGTHELKPGEQHWESLPLVRYCRFDRPGVYRISVSHDFGWRATAVRPIPVAVATIQVRMPTEEQARQVVDQMYALAADTGGSSGEKRQPYADFSALRYPVYLSFLEEHARHGDRKALQGIGAIPSPTATAALVRLANHKHLDFALDAVRTLNCRLPDPQLQDVLPRRNVFDNDREKGRRWLVKESWRSDLAPAVRALARGLLAAKDEARQECGAFILECIGGEEDLAALTEALDRALARSRKLPWEEQAYPRPRGACSELRRAAKMLCLRGVPVPAVPRTAGETLLFAIAVGAHKDFHPEGWEAQFETLLSHDIAYVRETALENLPIPAPDAFVKQVVARLSDPDVDVQIAACHVAGTIKAPAMKEPVLKVLATGRDFWVLNAAANAAHDLGIEPWRQMEQWVGRLDEEGMTATSLDYLGGLVIANRSNYGLPSAEAFDAAAGRACKERWQRFLRDNEAPLKRGARFNLGDPALTPDLFPQFTFYPRKAHDERER